MTSHPGGTPEHDSARSRAHSAPGRDGVAGYRTFVARALRNPTQVGAIAPSSASLAHEMAAVVPSTRSDDGTAPVVVELGPGTGALSAAVARRLPEGSRHIAIELDGAMVAYLRDSLPWLEVIQGNATDLAPLLRDAGVESVDAVISGLPWSIFPDVLQRDILREVGAVLASGGAFTTFAYVHALGMAGARGFRRRIGAAFDEVVTSRTVWRNLPPARIYVCRRPKA